ncbi:unnamed protein product [Allacma fusca]|uniref:C2 domain-containing protein n=1 Tax=Allacma fusca TaxID=39272 RepID=A0A8J2K6P7_9HEXA|nr:unnamed protein product [Allacma fusca]
MESDSLISDSMISGSSRSNHSGFSFTNWLEKASARQLTILFSSISVAVLVTMGLCIWVCVRFFKARIANNNLSSSDPHAQNLCCPKKGDKFRIIPHKNIFTPDQNFSFVVPTVPLQSQTSERRPLGRRLSTSHSLLQSTSLLGSEVKVPMMEHQFYPQFHQEDMDPRIGLSLYYSLGSQILSVKVIAGQNFPAKIPHFVKVKLYPGRSAKQRTKEFTGVTPEFYEEFNFHVRKNVIHTKVLKLRVLGSSVNGKGEEEKSLLGCVNIPMMDLKGLDQLDVLDDYRSGTMWKKLDQVSSLSDGVKLCTSLQWSQEPGPGLLTLKIFQASGLHETSDCDYTSSYVKVTLQERGKNMKSRKTRIVRWGSIPNYDDTFVVTLPYQLLSQISFMLMVIARGRLGSKVILGKISVGPVPFASPSSGSGTVFWEDMCHQPNVEIVRWLPLHS